MSFAESKTRILAALREVLATEEPSDLVATIRRALQTEETDAALTDPEKQTLELVMRMHMEELLAASKAPGASIEAAGVPKLLDVAIALAAGDGCDYNTPFALLEDLFDAHVISVAEGAFALVEARAAALAPFLVAEPKYQRCKLTLIRSCNELLRRLSKSKNTNFRGRVLMFMAYTFPLAERSGVNLKGVSAPSTVAVEEDAGEEPMMVEQPAGVDGSAGGVNGATGGGGAAEGGSGGGSGVVDFGFYATFWGLQQAFADPASSVANERWASLVEHLQTVLQVSSLVTIPCSLPHCYHPVLPTPLLPSRALYPTHMLLVSPSPPPYPCPSPPSPPTECPNALPRIVTSGLWLLLWRRGRARGRHRRRGRRGGGDARGRGRRGRGARGGLLRKVPHIIQAHHTTAARRLLPSPRARTNPYLPPGSSLKPWPTLPRPFPWPPLTVAALRPASLRP